MALEVAELVFSSELKGALNPKRGLKGALIPKAVLNPKENPMGYLIPKGASKPKGALNPKGASESQFPPEWVEGEPDV